MSCVVIIGLGEERLLGRLVMVLLSLMSHTSPHNNYTVG
jgi:hypothetical protein